MIIVLSTAAAWQVEYGDIWLCYLVSKDGVEVKAHRVGIGTYTSPVGWLGKRSHTPMADVGYSPNLAYEHFSVVEYDQYRGILPFVVRTGDLSIVRPAEAPEAHDVTYRNTEDDRETVVRQVNHDRVFLGHKRAGFRALYDANFSSSFTLMVIVAHVVALFIGVLLLMLAYGKFEGFEQAQDESNGDAAANFYLLQQLWRR